MRIVVIGASGQLGSDLMLELADHDAVGVDHATVDIEVPATIAAAIASHRPELVINTAAFHNVERCEAQPQRAFAVNALAVDDLARQCAGARAALLHVSTDYVFDGAATSPYDEDAAARPLSAYGISKYAGELAVWRHLSDAFVVRTSGLFGRRGSASKGVTFIERILTQASQGLPIHVVTDITFSPSYTRHVAAAIRRIVERNVYGTYHVTNDGFCSWYDFAVEILRQAGSDAPVARATSADFPSSVRRPPFSALAHGAFDRLGGPPLPTWRDGIRDYLIARG